jgi:hypothetical protein
VAGVGTCGASPSASHRSRYSCETCPISTGRGTRRVHLVRGGGGGWGGEAAVSAPASNPPPAPLAPAPRRAARTSCRLSCPEMSTCGSASTCERSAPPQPRRASSAAPSHARGAREAQAARTDAPSRSRPAALPPAPAPPPPPPRHAAPRATPQSERRRRRRRVARRAASARAAPTTARARAAAVPRAARCAPPPERVRAPRTRATGVLCALFFGRGPSRVAGQLYVGATLRGREQLYRPLCGAHGRTPPREGRRELRRERCLCPSPPHAGRGLVVNRGSVQ